MNNLKNATRYIFPIAFSLLLILSISVLVIAPEKADAALANSAWPMFHRDLKHTALSPYAGPTDNTVKWSFSASSLVRSSPVIGADGTIYFEGMGGADNRLYALYPNGAQKWSAPLDDGAGYYAPAIASDGTIYVSSARLYAFNPDGTRKWKTGNDVFVVYTAPAIAPDGTIYVCGNVGSGAGKVFAVRDNGTSYTKLWDRNLSGNNDRSSPAIGSDGTIYFGTSGGLLYAYKANGDLKWTYDAGAMIWSSPAIGNDSTVYFGAQNGGLYALTDNVTDAVLKWVDGGHWTVQSSPAIGADGTIYFGAGNGRVCAITDNGTNSIPKWEYLTGTDIGESSPAIDSNSTVYVGDWSGNVWAINDNGTSGDLKWSYITPGGSSDVLQWFFASPAIGSDGTIYIAKQSGQFLAFGDWDQIYVNGTTGNDSYNGGSPTYVSGVLGPKQTIAGGIAAVAVNGTVNVAAGTYHEHGLHLGFDMNLVGAGALTTIIDGDAAGHVISVSSMPYQENTISGFTIRNGAPSGSDRGGGIYISSSHIVTINDCAIVGNVRGAGSGPGLNNAGGGICNDGGHVYLNRCTISGNSAGQLGGGMANLGISPFGRMDISNCTIFGNMVTNTGAGGGGIYTASGATTNLLNVTIAGNSAMGIGSYGGGFSNSSMESMYFKNCIVANNTG